MLQTIVQYLIQGVAQKEIASIVGCSEGYISQVKERSDYDLLVIEAQKVIQQTEKQKERELTVEALEDMAYARLKEDMPFAEFREVTHLIEILHRRKDKPGVAIQINNQQINQDNRVQNVILQLPQAAVPEIRLNNQSEIIGIGDQSLAPMSANNVKSLFYELSVKKDLREKEKQAEMKKEREERKESEMKRQPVTIDDFVDLDK